MAGLGRTMIKFKQRYCKVHLPQYLSGDLSDITRRRVARFIDECQDCYDEYVRQRAIADQLQRSLPTLGHPDDQRLNSIWLSLRTELVPASGPGVARNNSFQDTPTMGYGLILIVLATMLLLTFTVGLQSSFIVIDLPPRPPVVRIAMTAEADLQARQITLYSTQSRVESGHPLLKYTPVPNFVR